MARVGPLSALRVLDLSRLLPGPYASLVLADLGADVVKIEDPNGGDYMRWSPPVLEDSSVLFQALNRGKRSVALDMKKKDDRALFLDLARKADVVMESFRPGVMAKLGIGWDELSAANPRLILVSISGYGQTGPFREKAGHDLNYMALAGVLGLLGASGAPPAQPNVQFADIAGGGLTPLVGLLAALFERQATGRGRWVDASMTEGVMASACLTVAPYLGRAGEVPERGRGILSGESACYAIYSTSDNRSLALGALEPKFWIAFCQAIGRPELESDGLSGGDDGQRTKAQVQSVIGAQPLEHWVAHFAQHDVCIEPVLTEAEVVRHPVHTARGSFFEGPHGLAQRTGIRFADRDDGPARTPAPGLGADRTAVLAEWLDASPAAT